MKRERRNLGGENIDFDLLPGPPPGVPYWLQGGPSDNTQVLVPIGTETVYVNHPAAEVALTPAEVVPRVAVYERDLNSASGGFNVFRYVRSVSI